MSKCGCNKFFNANNKPSNREPGIFYPNAGICAVCGDSDIDSAMQEVGFCPPIGEPQTLTLMAPAVFDESGVNLCRVIDINDIANACDGPTNRTTDIMFDGITRADLVNGTYFQLQVVDIDFNFVCPKSNRYSEIRPAKRNPNISRVVLRDIDVTFSIKVIDEDCKVCKEGMITLRYLACEDCPGYDDVTNPSNIGFDLYTPYGNAFGVENPAGCNKLVPIINYAGYVGGDTCQNCDCGEPQHQYKVFEPNNSLTQGITAQALAKVVANDGEYIAFGLTLYFKVVYFVQYKFNHEGLCVPPKFSAAGSSENSNCEDFCEGDLLEQSILPLSVCVEPKSF
ncbi:MAG: hypothetical protein ATN35_12340 [Epulopiscium sp. Nele67-Bin004]|nr:MAG: hypothetical protein ATN35_12340 [Epulopiscium sp. Nele67-Bin004]